MFFRLLLPITLLRYFKGKVDAFHTNLNIIGEWGKLVPNKSKWINAWMRKKEKKRSTKVSLILALRLVDFTRNFSRTVLSQD